MTDNSLNGASNTRPADGRPVANPVDVDIIHDLVTTANKAIPRVAINTAATVAVALLYAPALIPLAAVAFFEHAGRNHNMRGRPEIATQSAVARAKEKVAFHTNAHAPVPVWLASNEDQRTALEKADSAAYMRRIGWRQSWPFKAVSYTRLGVAMARDQINYLRVTRIYGQSGVSCHEGVAAARLARGNWITPNPRTQEHIRFARAIYPHKNLG